MAAPENEAPTVRTWMTVFLAAFLIAAAGGAAFGFLAGRLGTPAAPPSGMVTFELRAFISGYVGVGGTIDGLTNPVLEVEVGDTVTVTVTNGESLEHDLAVEGYEVQTQRLTTSGASDAITFLADEAGSFPYFCTVPGHRELGMEGLLIVGGGAGPSGPGPTLPLDVSDIAKDPTDLPPPITRNATATVHIFMEVREVVAEIESGTTFRYWTFNGSVPGPFFRVRLGDTVVVHFRNHENSARDHSVDFHAVTGPGGGAVATQTPPGEETTFQFKALNAGIFIYHCASGHIPSHIAMGMYGLILVEPPGGLPTVDREFYVVQGELYSQHRPGTPGHHEFDGEKMRHEDPEYVVFNGRFQALTGDKALKANTNETVRIYFGNAGPNLISSFHVIGEIFDRVYTMGDLLSPPALSVQTTPALPGGATAVEMHLEVPARYLLVDHAISRTVDKGALGFLEVAGPENPDVYQEL